MTTRVQPRPSPRRCSGFLTPRRVAGLVVALTGLCLFAGCATIPALRRAGVSSGYRPDNIFTLARVLPKDLRRVAVLPVSSSTQSADLADGREAVEPVLVAELIKTKRFEVIPISPQTLRARTGRDRWTAAEPLPVEFFAALRDACGCDAILFAELTEYRAYAPVAVGWRLKLVDARTGMALWAGDELFDARKAEVVAAAKHYQAAENRSAGVTHGEWAVLHSPRRFAQYSVAQLFDTLPLR